MGRGLVLGSTIAEKIIRSHSDLEGFERGKKISLRIDQTLTQDATGTMAYLQFEALGVSRVKTKLSVAYVDHNTLQNGFMNADDHAYIASVAKKHGIVFSRPGNGICHQLHLERFSKPGQTLIGSDSHTPTCGGVGMLSFGAGGFDVACAMAGRAYSITMPRIVRVNLINSLQPWVSAKDVILRILQILGVKGGVGKIIEYGGDGVLSLSVPERATIANMGAELGATTSIFPSDSKTLEFLAAQGRKNDWVEIKSDSDAVYDEELEIDLSRLTPMVACPHSPDNVETVESLAGLKIDQVCIGSCTNSSYSDMMKVAQILKGKKVADHVSLVVAPGSRQILSMMASNGALNSMVDAGARVLECACGPCIGMGQSPGSGGVSLRTFNRNFLGRSGTADAKIYLVSPEVAALSAVCGVLSDPTKLEELPKFSFPEKFAENNNLFVQPAGVEEAKNLNVVKGPNIKPFPVGRPITKNLNVEVALKVGDNITTDHIMPAGAKILPYRSNIAYLSQFCFEIVDPEFAKRAQRIENSIVVAGLNYGQGSSREHAALVPLYLGVRAVVAKSFARIHEANLINCGILPLTFKNPADYDVLNLGDEFEVLNLVLSIKKGSEVEFKNIKSGRIVRVNHNLSDNERQIILAGGLLNFLKKSGQVG